jgi:hypothetical protein
MKKATLVLCGAALLTAAAAFAAPRVTILVLDVPEHRATLLVKRSTVPGLRFLDSAGSLCRRQGPGSPLHSVYLGPTFCHLTVVHSGIASGENVYLRLPFSSALHALAD